MFLDLVFKYFIEYFWNNFHKGNWFQFFVEYMYGLCKSPISKSETQCKLLAVSLYTVKKISDISKLQWHRVCVCTTKGKQESSRKEWDRDTAENPQGKQ